jgi:hypothetical protein
VIWDARKTSDQVYHRRRFLIAIFITILWVGLVAIRLSDAAEHGWLGRDVLIVGTGAIAFLYFGRKTIFEFRKLRNAKHG